MVSKSAQIPKYVIEGYVIEAMFARMKFGR